MPTRRTPPRRYEPRDGHGRPRDGGRSTDRAASDHGASRRPVVDPGAGSGDRVHLALLPLRVFLGGMLLYAGLDKLLDPAFLHSTGPGSIGQQLEGFTHASPLTPLIQVFALPMPILVGLLIALAEIAIGLGALTGLLYRAAAAGGVALSILFWLTASWTTRPIYYGPDLPYAIGWLTLALAGSGELYTLRSWFDGLVDTEPAPGYEDYSSERRIVLQAVALGAVAVAVGGVGGVAGRILHGGDDTTAGSGLASLPGTSVCDTNA